MDWVKKAVNIQLPPQVAHILDTLAFNGFEGYVVGGCVRDSLLGRQVSDWDITTNALVDQLHNIFDRCIDTGAKHGTATIIIDDMHVEVTTYRIESEYSDFRRPDRVEFTSSLSEDLSRRDFTINAMAHNQQTGLIDLYGGIADLENKTIRTVGEPDKRFNEDALRIIRGVRFATTLGFTIHKDTMLSIKRNCRLLNNIAMERIKTEFNKILCSEGDLSLIHETGILAVTIPQLAHCFDIKQDNPHHIYDVGTHTLVVTHAAPPILPLRWAAFLHDIGKPSTKIYDDKGIAHYYGHNAESANISREILERFKFDNKTKDIIIRLIKHHDRQIELNPKAVKKAISKVGADIFELLIKLKWADSRGINPIYIPERTKYLERLEEIYFSVKDEPTSILQLAVNGDDLMQLGIMGRDIAIAKNALLDYVIEHPNKNNRKSLISFAKEFWRKHEG